MVWEQAYVIGATLHSGPAHTAYIQVAVVLPQFLVQSISHDIPSGKALLKSLGLSLSLETFSVHNPVLPIINLVTGGQTENILSSL